MVLVVKLLLRTCLICHEYQLCSCYFNSGGGVVIIALLKVFPSQLTPPSLSLSSPIYGFSSPPLCNIV